MSGQNSNYKGSNASYQISNLNFGSCQATPSFGGKNMKEDSRFVFEVKKEPN